jgi:hypothetical protein
MGHVLDNLAEVRAAPRKINLLGRGALICLPQQPCEASLGPDFRSLLKSEGYFSIMGFIYFTG